jgi:ankyrin repeat protein
MKTCFLAVWLSLAGVSFAAQGVGAATAGEGKVVEELISCVRAGDADCVKLLLAAGAKPDASDGRGVAALIIAAQGGSASVMRLLLDAGADVNGARKGEGTPLCRAALYGRREIAELLMERGAKLDVVCDSDHGDTPLMEALSGAMLAEMPDDLKEGDSEAGEGDEGGDADTTGEGREQAKPREVPKARPEEFLAIARSLLARGADVNAVAECDVGETALAYAAMGANVEMVKALLSRGADVRKGTQVLALLTQEGWEYERTKRLALPALSKEQNAGLAWFEKTRAAREEVRRLLRAAGAEDAEPEEAGENGRTDAEALEEIAGEAFASAVAEDDLKDLTRLIDAYAAHPLRKRVLTEALRLAIIQGRTETVELLLKRGADPDSEGRPARGATPLMHAARDGKLDFVRMLLDAGADVNREDDDGRTALDAVEALAGAGGDHRAVIELLKARGARGGRRE